MSELGLKHCIDTRERSLGDIEVTNRDKFIIKANRNLHRIAWNTGRLEREEIVDRTRDAVFESSLMTVKERLGLDRNIDRSDIDPQLFVLPQVAPLTF